MCGIYFPDQGSNLGTLHWEHSLRHWTIRKVPLLYVLIFLLYMFVIIRKMITNFWSDYFQNGVSLVAQWQRILQQCRRSFGGEDPLEKKKTATHSSILVWEIPWRGKPGELQSMVSQRVQRLNSNILKTLKHSGDSLKCSQHHYSGGGWFASPLNIFAFPLSSPNPPHSSWHSTCLNSVLPFS